MRLFDGRYDILGQLGEGGMGIVLEARDERTGRTVALKRLRTRGTDSADRAFFDREFAVLSGLRVEGVPRAYERGEVDGQPYFTMEPIDAVPFDRWFRARRPSWREAAECLARAANALEGVHRAGVVHGDVKPGNLLVDGRDEPWWIDFGIGSPRDAAMLPEESECIYGTLAYLPVERIADTPVLRDHRSDQYSLGVILHEVLSGRQPFVARSSTELMQRIETEPPPPLHRCAGRRLPQAISAVVERALSKRPEDRYPTVREFAMAALEAVGGSANAAPARSRPERERADLRPVRVERTVRRVLVPLDGTREAERALGQALPIASRTGASILLLHVLDGDRTDGNAKLAARGFVPTRIGAYLRDRRALIREMGHAAETLVEEGDAVAQILAVSRTREIDLIVMSSDADGPLDVGRLGPVVTGVLDRGAVSMLIVPPTGEGWFVDLSGLERAAEAELAA